MHTSAGGAIAERKIATQSLKQLHEDESCSDRWIFSNRNSTWFQARTILVIIQLKLIFEQSVPLVRAKIHMSPSSMPVFETKSVANTANLTRIPLSLVGTGFVDHLYGIMWCVDGSLRYSDACDGTNRAFRFAPSTDDWSRKLDLDHILLWISVYSTRLRMHFVLWNPKIFCIAMWNHRIFWSTGIPCSSNSVISVLLVNWPVRLRKPWWKEQNSIWRFVTDRSKSSVKYCSLFFSLNAFMENSLLTVMVFDRICGH